MRIPIRICRVLCCILVLSLLSGCGISSLVSRYEALEQQTKIDTNENRYMSRIILDLLNKKDLAGLKGLFCLKSQSLPDIEKQISAGFQSIKGNIISFNEKNTTGYEGNSFEQGRRTFLERSWTITDIKAD